MVHVKVLQLLQDCALLGLINAVDGRGEELQASIMVKPILELICLLIHGVALAAQLMRGNAAGNRSIQAADAPVDDLLIIPVGLVGYAGQFRPLRKSQLVVPEFTAARLQLLANDFELISESSLLHPVEMPLDVLLVQLHQPAVVTGLWPLLTVALHSDVDDRLVMTDRDPRCAGLPPCEQVLLRLVDGPYVEWPIQVLTGHMAAARGRKA